jgi:outer membrane protein assembly factor BamE (lipoprotein component of BamABCDE complex)
MKTTSRTYRLLLAALGVTFACSLPAAPAKNPPSAFPVKELLSVHCWMDIYVGASEREVLENLGSPLCRPTETMWVYRGYVADREDANKLGCHKLLVTFNAKGSVESFKLINDEALAVIRRRAKTHSTVLPSGVFVVNP